MYIVALYSTQVQDSDSEIRIYLDLMAQLLQS